MFSKQLHFLGLITFITQGSGQCLITNTGCDKEVTWFCEGRAVMTRPAQINTEKQDTASFSLPEQAHKHSLFRSQQESPEI